MKNNKRLFSHVSQIGVTKVLVGFNVTNKTYVNEFISALINEFKTSFGNVVADKVFGFTHGNTVLRPVTKTKSGYTTELKKKLYSNPQECDDTNDSTPQEQTTPKKTYFGRAPITPTHDDTSTFVDIVNQPSTTQPPIEKNAQVDSLENIVKELKEENAKIQETLQVTNKTVEDLKNHVNDEVSQIRTEIDSLNESTTGAINNFIDEQKRINAEKDAKDEAFKLWLTNNIVPQPKPPRGVEQSSARGATE